MLALLSRNHGKTLAFASLGVGVRDSNAIAFLAAHIDDISGSSA